MFSVSNVKIHSNVQTAAKYPLPLKVADFVKTKSWIKLLIVSQPIIKGMSLICGGQV